MTAPRVIQRTLVCLILLRPVDMYAQHSAPEMLGSIGVVVGGIISFNPPAFEGMSGGPYLDQGLGGTVPGLSVALSATSEDGAHLTVEASLTTSFEVMQKGRFVTGSGPASPTLATYRDTMVSVLPGVHLRLGRTGGAIEPKGGVSLLVGGARRANEVSGSSIALTAGVDGVMPINTRVALVPSFRYSHAFRGESALQFGLGSNIVKVGFGVRLRLGR